MMMSDLLKDYEARLRDRDIGASSGPTPARYKFEPDGNTKPFYGLTCIAWVGQGSELFRKLCDLQGRLRKELEEAGLGYVFAFLEPESFHMTICDIVVSPNPIQTRHADVLIRQSQAAFAQIGKPGQVISQVRGIGLKSTLTALVRFDRELELKKVLAIEHEIKQSIGQSINADLTDLAQSVSFRPFAGHISLAYCVREPGAKNVGRIKEILLQYDKDIGEFAFAQFDLVCFAHMNAYTPVLTMNLENGQVTRHNRRRACQHKETQA
jgi:hypothetical protein